MKKLILTSLLAFTGMNSCAVKENTPSDLENATIRDFLKFNKFSGAEASRYSGGLEISYIILTRHILPRVGKVIMNRNFRRCMLQYKSRISNNQDASNYENLITIMTDPYKYQWPRYSIEFKRTHLHTSMLPINEFNTFTRIPYYSNRELETHAREVHTIDFDPNRWETLGSRYQSDQVNFRKSAMKFVIAKVFNERKFPTSRGETQPSSFSRQIEACTPLVYNGEK